VKLAFIIGIALAGLTAAEEALPGKPGAAAEIRRFGPTPWLGVKFVPLDDAVRAQVPQLPPGFGFVVAAVDAGGPADLAGVRQHDIFWKLDDQWIANGDQLLALLHLHGEGAAVDLGLYRSGKPLTVPVELGRAPQERLADVPAADPAREKDVPMKVLKPAEGSAEISEADGRAVLTLVKGLPEVRITSPSGSVIFAGPVRGDDGASLVPVAWQVRVAVLERGLAHAMKSGRPPRARVLPTPSAPAE
jgi:hypothetical protein